tara:strand:- start:1356 stop:2324 length:969 start_codon:yes stop_codon:yes gene_type:complete
MSTIIVIDGGIGRVVAAIPTLLKYHKNHSNEEWYVMVHGWDSVFWGFSELQERTFNPNDKSIFKDYFWNATKIIKPEPYSVPGYYRNEISLREAFDIEINGSTDSDLPEMQLKLSMTEIRNGHRVIAEAKNHQKKKKTIVIQPYGSTALMCPLEIFDDSLRSIPQKMYLTLVNKLSKDYNIIYMGAKEFHDNISYKPEPDPSLRDWAGVIKAADYFIGCDSCGQHFAKAVGQNASIMIAGTHKINVTYPDTFHIIERDCEFYPDAMRISQIQGQLSSRLNEERILFTDEEIEDAYQTILKNIGQEKSNKLVEVKSNKSLSYE